MASANAQTPSQKFWAWARENEREFIETFCKVVNKDAVKVNFKLNIQQIILDDVINYMDSIFLPVRFACVKYRQPGISKYMGVKLFARSASRENRTSLITAHRKTAAEKNLRLQKQHVGNLPTALRPQVGVDNRSELYLADRNCSITCNSANDPAAIRGDTCNDWALTEAAYYGEQGASLSEVMDAGIQQVPEAPGSLIGLETTANGTSDEFYDFYNLAKTVKPGNYVGENGFKAVFLNWRNDPLCQRGFHADPKYVNSIPFSDHPEARSWDEARAIRNKCAECNKKRQEWAKDYLDKDLKARMLRYKLDLEQIHWYWYWLNRRCRGDKLKMMQEYPCDDVEAFIASGTPLFDAETIALVKEQCKRGKLYDVPMENCQFEDLTDNDQLVRNKESYLEIWDKPRPGRQYLWFADSSLGQAKGNPSAAYCVDMDSMDTVAALHGRFDPDLYGETLTFVGYLYNIALIAPEVENTGHAVLAALNRLNYPNIYQRYQLTPEGWMQTQQLGWSTNMRTKPQMVAVGRKTFNMLAASPKQIANKIKDAELCDELSKFTIGSFGNRAMGAKSGACDDRCIAWFGSQMVCHQEAGIDIGDAPSISKEAASAKEFELKQTVSRLKVRPPSEIKEMFRKRKLFMKGYDIEDIEDGRDIISQDDWDDDDYYLEDAVNV